MRRGQDERRKEERREWEEEGGVRGPLLCVVSAAAIRGESYIEERDRWTVSPGFRQKSINDFPWVSLSFGPKWGLFSLKKYWNDANFPWVNVVSDGEIVHFSWKFGTPFLFNIIETSQWLKRDLRGHHGWPRREKFLKIRYSKPWNTSYSVIRNLENKIPWVSLSNP